MTHVRIRPRFKSSMQSGRAQENMWILEYEPRVGQRPDPLTGWAGSSDTRGQVNMSFPTLEAAKAYAEKHDLTYHVSAAEGGVRNLKLQAYADNFKGPDLSL